MGNDQDDLLVLNTYNASGVPNRIKLSTGEWCLLPLYLALQVKSESWGGSSEFCISPLDFIELNSRSEALWWYLK